MNLNELIQNAIDHGACYDVINQLKQYKTFDDALQDADAPEWCYWYALHVINGRWKEGEKAILLSSQLCFWYAFDVIKERWKECEPVVLKSLNWSYFYARDIIKERWKEAESVIFSNDFYKRQYCKHFNIIE